MRKVDYWAGKGDIVRGAMSGNIGGKDELLDAT